MRSQISKLQNRINALEARQATAAAKTVPASPPRQTQAAIPQGPTSPHVGEATASKNPSPKIRLRAARFNNISLDPKYQGYCVLPGTQKLLKIGGYFKTDFMYDLKPAGNADEFIPSSILIPTIQGVHNSSVSVLPTRLSLGGYLRSSPKGNG